MSSTCSFIIDEEYHKNHICFASLRHITNSKKIIVLEKEKQNYFGKEYCLEYINDLKEIGFKFDSVSIDDLESILIDITSLKKKSEIISFCMLIRYLWEGKYNTTDRDSFYKTIEIYKFLIEIEYKKLSKLELLCLAHNIFIIEYHKNNTYTYNSNHYLCYNSGCKILKNIDELINSGNINDFMSLSFVNYVEISELRKKFINFTMDKKDINKVYNFVMKQQKIKNEFI